MPNFMIYAYFRTLDQVARHFFLFLSIRAIIRQNWDATKKISMAWPKETQDVEATVAEEVLQCSSAMFSCADRTMR